MILKMNGMLNKITLEQGDLLLTIGAPNQGCISTGLQISDGAQEHHTWRARNIINNYLIYGRVIARELYTRFR